MRALPFGTTSSHSRRDADDECVSRSAPPIGTADRDDLLGDRHRSGDPDRGCFRSVYVVSPIVEGCDPAARRSSWLRRQSVLLDAGRRGGRVQPWRAGLPGRTITSPQCLHSKASTPLGVLQLGIRWAIPRMSGSRTRCGHGRAIDLSAKLTPVRCRGRSRSVPAGRDRSRRAGRPARRPGVRGARARAVARARRPRRRRRRPPRRPPDHARPGRRARRRQRRGPPRGRRGADHARPLTATARRAPGLGTPAVR
jgi:hypothetical protein